MEAAGFALGVAGAVGVIGQLLDGCLKAYKIFTTASNLGRDSERLAVKIRIEEMRLMVWGREWGVSEGNLEKHLSRLETGPYQDSLRALAQMILTQLYQTIMDLNRLQDRYGLREQEPGSVDKEWYEKSKDPSYLTNAKANHGMKLKARWVFSDKDKSSMFLEDLQFFNDRLEKLFPPIRLATFRRTWANELLQERDPGQLDLLEAASHPLYPGLGTFAQLKQLRINLDAREPSRKVLSSSELKIQRWRVTIQMDSNNNGRCQAIYQRPLNNLEDGSASEDVAVFIEWTEFSSASSFDERLHLYQRVDNLARMLHSSSNRHPDLHTLDCIGYIEDTQESRYGLLYVRPPHTSSSALIQTLASVIETVPTPDLEVRFRIAHTLAISLASCHCLDLLHKTLEPENILFFTSIKQGTSPAIDIGSPYLAGFDSSRPDYVDEMSRASKNMVEEDLYRHPDSLGPDRMTYCKAFDVYSLGLLLLEIGLWKSLETFHKGKYARYTRAEFRDKVIQALVPALGSKTGSSYRDVVFRCLALEVPETKALKTAAPQELMEGVLQTLESLNV